MRKPEAAHSGRPRFVTGMAPPRRRREDIGDAIGEGAGDGALRSEHKGKMPREERRASR